MSIAEFNWDLFPLTKLEETNMLTPLGCMFTPFQGECPSTDKELMLCSQCGGAINPHIRIDRQNRMWWCPLCRKTTPFPKSFELPEKNSADADIPIQIRPSAQNTIDYVLPTDISQSPAKTAEKLVVTCVLDRYQHTDALHLNEFNALKKNLITALAKLPLNTKILLVTFADCVEVHAPGNDTVAFSSEALKVTDDANLSVDGILDTLRKKLFTTSEPPKDALAKLGYLLEPSQELFDYIDSIKPKLTSSFKAPRETGLAFLITALFLTNFCESFSHGKIHAFFSGPATVGLGKVVTEGEHIRSHNDVANFKAPHFALASKFYRYISYILCGYKPADAYQAVYTSRGKLVDYTVADGAPRFSCDLYTGSLDQVGVYEMKHLAEASGGSIELTDSFSSIKFAHALARHFVTSSAESCKLTVLTSAGVKVMKAIAAVTELQSSYQSSKLMAQHYERISDSVTKFDSSLKKRNFTNQWYLGQVSDEDTVAVYFELETASSSSALSAEGTKEVYIQFRLKYWDPKRLAFVLRVVTVKKSTTLAILAANQVKLSNGKWRLVNTKSNIIKEKVLMESFNAKAWMALFARLLISKIDTTIGFESFEGVVNEVDNALLRILKIFGGVTVEAENTDVPLFDFQRKYSISLQFKDLPAFSYSLRRNPQLVRIFNSSPDETAFNHHLFLKRNSLESCRMIRPVLYKLEGDVLEVIPLNVGSLVASETQQFYVLDSGFNVIVYNQFSRPEDKLGLHNSSNEDLVYKPEIGALKKVLGLVRSEITERRNFEPSIILTQKGHSQARFLTARLHPTGDIEVPDTKTAKPKWWQFTRSKAQISVDPEDLSQKQFYEDLIQRMENFRVENDY